MGAGMFAFKTSWKIFATLSCLLAVLAIGAKDTVAQSAGGQRAPVLQEARIVIYRQTSLIGIGNVIDVPFLHVDSKRLGRIRMGGYFSFAVAPGQHKIFTTESFFGGDTGKVRGSATVTVPAGTALYLRYSETFGSITPIPLPIGVIVHSTGVYHFEPVAAATAKSEMSGMNQLTP